MAHSQEKKEIPEEAESMDLLDKEFNYFKCAQNAEGRHGQRTKGNQETKFKQLGNINREIEIIKSTIAEIKISGSFGGIFEQAKERIKKT